MLRYGSKEAAFYRGAGKPARLYKGTQLVAGWTPSGKTVPCAWDATYNDTVYLDALGTAQQKSYSGKNLLNPAPWETPDATEKYTIKYLPDEDCFVLNGTFETTMDSASRNINIPLDAGATYTLRCDIVSGSFTSPRHALFYLGGVGSLRNWFACQFGQTAAAAAPGDAATRGWFYFTGGTVCTDLKLKIQLEKAAAATEYEPYVGGQPSPNPDYPQELTASQATLTGSDRTGSQTESLRLPVLRQIIGTEVRDELHGKTLTRRVGVIERYNAETVGAVWCSTTGQLTTGATVWYQLAEPVTQELDAELKTYIGYTTLDVEGTLLPEITATAKVAI